MSSPSSKAFKRTSTSNTFTLSLYEEKLREIAISRFKWNNLPDTVDPRFIEWVLINDGPAVFFRDDVMGYLCLQTRISGPLDVYQTPIRRDAYAVNGYNKELTKNDSVLIFNNYQRTNDALIIDFFSTRLYDIQCAIDTNVKLQKTPKILKVPEDQRLTIINLLKQYEGNYAFILGDKNLDLKQLDSVDITAPYVADRLFQLKQDMWREALTYFGVYNYKPKKERAITLEITSELGDVEALRFSCLAARQDAAEKINKMFGLNISVNYRNINEDKEDEQ